LVDRDPVHENFAFNPVCRDALPQPAFEPVQTRDDFCRFNLDLHEALALSGTATEYRDFYRSPQFLSDDVHFAFEGVMQLLREGRDRKSRFAHKQLDKAARLTR
jgi:hypothetical protein